LYYMDTISHRRSSSDSMSEDCLFHFFNCVEWLLIALI
jgi:hypothetical protein